MLLVSQRCAAEENNLEKAKFFGQTGLSGHS
jgi:hypothetical protein